MKLTRAQWLALREIAAGRCTQRPKEAVRGARIDVLNCLIRAGYAYWDKPRDRPELSGMAYITDSGLAALQEARG